MRTGRSEGWLARLADPNGPAVRYSPPPFDASEREGLQKLMELAARHNVRPAFARNLVLQLKGEPRSLLSGERHDIEATARWLLDQAEDLRVADFVRGTLLAETAAQIMEKTAAAGIPAVVVKGADFAEAAYGGLQFRTFSDVDLLVRPDAQPELAAILRDLGLEEHAPSEKRADYTERAWTRRDAYGGTTLVEVHTDMVHAPELRAAQSLTYDLYAGPDHGGVTPAARMVLAGLHGATSHLFGRLQYVIDGLMIARMGVDADELAERASLSRAALPVATMLRLAHDLYGCPLSKSLLDRIGPSRWRRLERHLIHAGMVLAAKGEGRWRLLPQRYLYRRLLRST